MDALSVIFGIHTFEITHNISKTETVYIKSLLGLKIDDNLRSTKYYTLGIDEIEIIENSYTNKEGKYANKYTLRLLINAAMVLDISKYKIMPLTPINMKKLLKQLNKIFCNTFRLSSYNNKADKWKVKRIDFAYDITFPHPELLMRLLTFSLDVNHNNCKLKFNPKLNKMKDEYKSIRFGNNSYTYNIYIKIKELENKGKELTENEKIELKSIIRYEKQHMIDGVKKILGTHRELGTLLISKTIENIQRIMQNDSIIFFGKGSFYNYSKLKKIINESSYSTDQKDTILTCLIDISKNGLFDVPKYSNSKEIKMLENVGVARAGLRTSEAKNLRVDKIQSLYEMITSFHPLGRTKRKKREFPKPIKDKHGRWKANISLHFVDSEKTVIFSIADKDKEKYEQKVLDKLVNVFESNIRFLRNNLKNRNEIQYKMFKKSIDDILRFKKCIESKNVKTKADSIIQKYNLLDGIYDKKVKSKSSIFVDDS